jgi:hypothetical protein
MDEFYKLKTKYEKSREKLRIKNSIIFHDVFLHVNISGIDTINEYESRIKPYLEKTSMCYFKLLNIVTLDKYILTPPENFCDYYSIGKFTEHCKNKEFIDDDGIGYLSVNKQKSNWLICPSDITMGGLLTNKLFDGVFWYNK